MTKELEERITVNPKQCGGVRAFGDADTGVGCSGLIGFRVKRGGSASGIAGFGGGGRTGGFALCVAAF